MSHPATRKLIPILESFQKSRKTWDELNLEGLSTANQLVNTKLQERYVDDNDTWLPRLDSFPEVRCSYESKMSNLVAQMSEKLNITLSKLVNIGTNTATKIGINRHHIYTQITQHRRMKGALSQSESLLNDTYNFYGPKEAYDTLAFRTYTLDAIVSLVRKAVLQYTKEITQKIMIVSTLATTDDRELAMSYLSTWLNEPHLKSGFLQDMDEILEIETGL
ncbi:hypothetical protein K493DRAFT_339903 [Basidiobolus meristosporus CBS 931.73]|uniref:Uncharacterized protein n=1 Tax=Basidiobolus meristosporus CBS 931.73 TaxID=1314790 RepID=A0A1Y1XXX7_9FUNG|nr:hypothetical protein K493DRAFT_339903 [Basidiobolus meristosporus CBS 931.73]|eukprot:ORX90610.1 hypothetical protein K493DRAFT_339903 [Basidiobolus meristosporus CBS 931.73]